MKTNTLNSIAQEKYGKDYNHLPDDGAEQDFVQGEYARREKLSTIKPINGLNEPEKAFEIEAVKHTPTPFKCCQESADKNWWIVTDLRNNIVANVNCETGIDLPPLVSTKMPAENNAQFIVTACNNHAALVAALTRFEQRAIDLGSNGFAQEIAIAREAIKNAKGSYKTAMELI